jgi:glycyl-tRNA synthetase alpha chain
LRLQNFWDQQGCVLLQPYDMEVGAGTFHTATFLRAIGPGALERRLRAAVAPPEGRSLRRESEPAATLLSVSGHHEAVTRQHSRISIWGRCSALGIDTAVTTISASSKTTGNRPTLGAWGLGWEVWLNGMEVTQFTYFPGSRFGIPCQVRYAGESHLWPGTTRDVSAGQGQPVRSRLDRRTGYRVTYGDVYHQNEVEQSKLQLRTLRCRDWLFRQFSRLRIGRPAVCSKPDLPLPGYELVMKCSHVVQSARRSRRHFGHRTRGLYWSRPCAWPVQSRRLTLIPARPSVSDVQDDHASRGAMK